MAGVTVGREEAGEPTTGRTERRCGMQVQRILLALGICALAVVAVAGVTVMSLCFSRGESSEAAGPGPGMGSPRQPMDYT